MKLGFDDVCRRTEQNYDKHIEMFGSNISAITVMELIILCVVLNANKGKGEQTFKQFDRFLRDLGGRIDEL